MFELNVSLLRLLEAIVLDGQKLFFGAADRGISLTRVVELMLHMLSRLTSNDLFESVMTTHQLALNELRKIAMLSPIVGTLMLLVHDRAGSPMADGLASCADFAFDAASSDGLFATSAPSA